MTKSGQVTAQHLCSKHGKADKAIDLFIWRCSLLRRMPIRIWPA